MEYIYLGLVSFCFISVTFSMTKKEKVELRDTVKDMFNHAYGSYMTHAFPADELMPLLCKGRFRGTEPSRGDVDDILGNFSMTLIDSLDSLAIFGEVEKFEEGVKLVIEHVRFDSDIVVSVFETNIRVLGGLLGGHVAADVLKRDGHGMPWYNDELLVLAKDVGERLLPAFNTTTGIPYPRVNLKYGVTHPRSRTGTESDTCTACAGTMIMEFGALSRLTGDPVFEVAAHKAMMALWTYRSRTSDLVGTVINIHNGEWVRRDSGVGAGIDSYYEYCLKAYILLGEEEYLQRFNQHYKAIMRYINKGSMFVNVHMHNPSRSSYSYMDALQAFWPGLQVLKGDLKSAIELHEVFYSVAKRHTFLPEAFTTNLEVHWGQHLLRPELVESTYFLYEATKDPYYLDVGRYIVENLNRYTRVPCGFAAVKDVRTLSHEDRMDSFLLSETLKYLYLLFSEKNDMLIDIHDFVFTTEAHILPLALSNWNGSSDQNYLQSEHLHDHSCPSATNDKSLMTFAEEVRRKSRSKGRKRCQKRTEQYDKVTGTMKSGPPPLRAEQFIPGNIDHLGLLKSMGITVSKTSDGKVQLMQNAAVAETTELAAEGIKFMQSMIELAKFRSEDGAAENLPRVVQILTPPYNGHIVLNAGPAQFGIDLAKTGMGVSAEVILADPITGCTVLNNKELVDHRIALMERGQCMFIDKVRQAESAGAVAAIIVDNNEGSSSESQPMFAMSGDGSTTDINIPAVFLFAVESDVIRKAMQLTEKTKDDYLKVRLANKAAKPDSKDRDSSSKDAETKEQVELSQTHKEQKILEKLSVTKKCEEKGNDGKPKTMHNLKQIMDKLVGQPGFDFITKHKTEMSTTVDKTNDKIGNIWVNGMLVSSEKDKSLDNFKAKQKAAEEADLSALNDYKRLMTKTAMVNDACLQTTDNIDANELVCTSFKDKYSQGKYSHLYCSKKSDVEEQKYCNGEKCSLKMRVYQAVVDSDGTLRRGKEITGDNTNDDVMELFNTGSSAQGTNVEKDDNYEKDSRTDDVAEVLTKHEPETYYSDNVHEKEGNEEILEIREIHDDHNIENQEKDLNSDDSMRVSKVGSEVQNDNAESQTSNQNAGALKETEQHGKSRLEGLSSVDAERGNGRELEVKDERNGGAQSNINNQKQTEDSKSKENIANLARNLDEMDESGPNTILNSNDDQSYTMLTGHGDTGDPRTMEEIIEVKTIEKIRERSEKIIIKYEQDENSRTEIISREETSFESVRQQIELKYEGSAYSEEDKSVKQDSLLPDEL